MNNKDEDEKLSDCRIDYIMEAIELKEKDKLIQLFSKIAQGTEKFDDNIEFLLNLFGESHLSRGGVLGAIV